MQDDIGTPPQCLFERQSDGDDHGIEPVCSVDIESRGLRGHIWRIAAMRRRIGWRHVENRFRTGGADCRRVPCRGLVEALPAFFGEGGGADPLQDYQLEGVIDPKVGMIDQVRHGMIPQRRAADGGGFVGWLRIAQHSGSDDHPLDVVVQAVVVIKVAVAHEEYRLRLCLIQLPDCGSRQCLGRRLRGKRGAPCGERHRCDSRQHQQACT